MQTSASLPNAVTSTKSALSLRGRSIATRSEHTDVSLAVVFDSGSRVRRATMLTLFIGYYLLPPSRGGLVRLTWRAHGATSRGGSNPAGVARAQRAACAA